MDEAVHPPEDAVLFDSGGVRVTTRSVRLRGRTWGLDHICGVTVLFQPPSDRLLRVVAVLTGALFLADGYLQGPLVAITRAGSVASMACGAAVLLGYAALARRVLHAERTCIWLHTRFSSQVVYRGRYSSKARALAHALREAMRQREGA